MSAANKRRGAAYELDLLKGLRNEGFDAERLRLSGRLDEGDLILKTSGLPWIIEAKNAKQMDLSGWCREAEVEARNYAAARGIPPAHFAVFIKKRNAGLFEGYAVTPIHEWLRQISQTPF